MYQHLETILEALARTHKIEQKSKIIKLELEKQKQLTRIKPFQAMYHGNFGQKFSGNLTIEIVLVSFQGQNLKFKTRA